MKNTAIINSLFNWFDKCEVLNPNNKLNVDYLSENPEEYSIEVVPCDEIINAYADGSAKCQYLFIFASRNYYGDDSQLNMSNLAFFEQLEDWITEQNANDNLPILPEGCTSQSIKVLSSGYAEDNDAQTARYQIQCRLKYVRRK